MTQKTQLTQKPQPPAFLDKALAAQRLGLSVRRVLELSNIGKLGRKRVINHQTGRHQVVISAADVERMLAEQRAAPAPDSQALALRAPEPPAVLKLWLTLEQAEDYSGLPASVLLMLIHYGDLRARDVGVRPGGRWRVRKVDLDALEGEVYSIAQTVG